MTKNEPQAADRRALRSVSGTYGYVDVVCIRKRVRPHIHTNHIHTQGEIESSLSKLFYTPCLAPSVRACTAAAAVPTGGLAGTPAVCKKMLTQENPRSKLMPQVVFRLLYLLADPSSTLANPNDDEQ